ncbi:hepatitis A virus cellular receptor 1 homolog [Etheostoma cragini]|uniref:hepatitis A virus cellular receptor 1 homolog n=1 Tax=Etheostoma cragini TaxID=417921 RepID=UPI00155E6C0C|nr:hepatitis A virus cellular receptor 1 homolog [Etheostoma cragini]
MMKLVLLLALLTVSECDDNTVTVQTGEDITLPCKYDIKIYKALSVCWGRGQIPSSGCNNQLVATDGHEVKEETRVSSRYKLLGRLDDGDVSLTILNVSETDAGHYGCRVEIPGWFNDDKHHFILSVRTAPQTTTLRTLNEPSTEQTAATYTAGQMSSTQLLLTSHTSNIESKERSGMSMVLLFALFGLIALIIAGVAFLIIASRRMQLNKMPQQQVTSSVMFSSTASTLHLQSQGLAVENIYQIDGGGDGGEYESCP